MEDGLEDQWKSQPSTYLFKHELCSPLAPPLATGPVARLVALLAEAHLPDLATASNIKFNHKKTPGPRSWGMTKKRRVHTSRISRDDRHFG